MPHPETTHAETYLNIVLPTNMPAALHAQLLRGLSAAFKQCMQHPPNTAQETEDIAALAILQQALIPTEGDLQKAYKKEIIKGFVG